MTPTEIRNEDWLRTRTWDGPDTLDGLIAVLVQGARQDADAKEVVRAFLRLPAAGPIPQPLKDGITKRWPDLAADHFA